MVDRRAASLARRDASILLLTEDSAGEATDTIRAVVHRIFGLLVDGYQSQRVGFDPPPKVLVDVLHANRWKEFRKDERLRNAYVTLVRTIATTLLQANGFVVFHFDGDRVWSAQHESENVAKFDQLIRLPVKQALLMMKEPDPDARLKRLFPLVPFYSIEAWLYQNTRRAIEICQAQYRGADVEQFERWQTNPGELDEIVKVKTTTCLGASHNQDLARGLDADQVYAVGKSFTRSVDAMLLCAELSSALSRTKEG